MKHFLLFSCLAVCLSVIAGAQPEPGVAEVTERLQLRYEMIDDLTAQFTQHVKFGFSNIEQTFTGTLSMKKPNKYRIESEHQTLVTDGETVWAYSPVNSQVVVDRYKENRNSISPEQFVLNLPENYYATILASEKGKNGKLITLKLVPKDDRSFVRSVKIWVEDGDWSIRKVTIIDVNDTETTYSIKDLKLNTNIKDKSFTFSAPNGTEIVDLRQ
ncbi:MAG: outer membrane lipoprotein chaperone LolA [Ignavibacteriales bacterium]|nr:outer membrane lipoprotein chaperone LolA [Ignavibacteriales bacterium]